jgi:hypothetical protein
MKPLESIRQDIEDIRELILSLDDEIWSRIDHRDNDALTEFLARKTQINEKIKGFQNAGNDLLDSLAELPFVQLPSPVAPSLPEKETIAPLDRSFAFTKPTAFLIDGNRIEPARSWRVLWQKFLEDFHQRNPGSFEEHLVCQPCIAGTAASGDKFQDPFECGGRWFECGLSANAIRDRIKRILLFSGIETNRMKIALRGNPDLEGTIFDL